MRLSFFEVFKVAFAELLLLSIVHCKVLPDTYQICYRDDPNLRKCLTTEGNRVLKQFTKGLPNIGIVSTDPFELGDFDVFPKNSGSLYLTQKKGVLRGLRNTKILDLIIDPVKKTGLFHVLSNVTIKAQYLVRGQILLFPIRGEGDSVIKLKGFDVKVKWNWSIFTGKDGLEYTHMDNYTIDFDFDTVTFKMTGLFDNNKLLGDATTRIINENAREIMNELGKPAVELVIERMVKVINQFFSRVPYEEILPFRPK